MGNIFQRRPKWDTPNGARLFQKQPDLFLKKIASAERYFEYGCGASTMWVSKYTKVTVTSVDTHGGWISHVADHTDAARVSLHHVDLGALGDWGRPKSYDHEDRFSEYTDYLWQQDVQPDLVLVDGRFRVCCFLTCLKYADVGTGILFDDYTDRPHYHIVEKFLKPTEQNERQAYFVVDAEVKKRMAEIDSYIGKFRYVLD